jgi:hypothetical protein
MAGDPKGTYETARVHAHRARKSAGRLAVSGLGFSVAYFFDPDHGSARRKQAVVLANQVRRAAAHVKSRRGQKATRAQTPPQTQTSPATAGPEGAPSPRGLTNGSRSSARS